MVALIEDEPDPIGARLGLRLRLARHEHPAGSVGDGRSRDQLVEQMLQPMLEAARRIVDAPMGR